MLSVQPGRVNARCPGVPRAAGGRACSSLPRGPAGLSAAASSLHGPREAEAGRPSPRRAAAAQRLGMEPRPAGTRGSPHPPWRGSLRRPERCGGGAGRRRGQWARAAVAMRAPTLPAGRAPRCAPPRRAGALPGWCAAGTKGRAAQVGAGAAGRGGGRAGQRRAGRRLRAGSCPRAPPAPAAPHLCGRSPRARRGGGERRLR